MGLARDIEFRGYDPIAECWCIGLPLEDAYILGRWYIMCNYSDGIIVVPESIGQYLGVKDKNGKKIYEGDIVRTDEAGWIACVVYSRDGFMCIDSKGGFSAYDCHWENFEVIGNIHENPEIKP